MCIFTALLLYYWVSLLTLYVVSFTFTFVLISVQDYNNNRSNIDNLCLANVNQLSTLNLVSHLCTQVTYNCPSQLIILATNFPVSESFKGFKIYLTPPFTHYSHLLALCNLGSCISSDLSFMNFIFCNTHHLDLGPHELCLSFYLICYRPH